MTPDDRLRALVAEWTLEADAASIRVVGATCRRHAEQLAALLASPVEAEPSGLERDREWFMGAADTLLHVTYAETSRPVDHQLYFELLYQVETKHPGETRHETARRYIRQAETPAAPDPSQEPKP